MEWATLRVSPTSRDGKNLTNSLLQAKETLGILKSRKWLSSWTLLIASPLETSKSMSFSFVYPRAQVSTMSVVKGTKTLYHHPWLEDQHLKPSLSLGDFVILVKVLNLSGPQFPCWESSVGCYKNLLRCRK